MNAGIKLGILLSVAPVGITAQSFLEEFSYDGLRFSGIGVDVGRVWSGRLSAAWSPGLRIDYGLVAPRVRVAIGMHYFRGQLNSTEIAEFEASLRRVVNDPTGDAVITVGQIDWGTFASYVDFHYLIPTRGRLLWYVGTGLGIQLWNGSGPAIDGTFVEDALDTVVASVSGMAGFEVALSRTMRFTFEGRGGLTSELRTASTRVGFAYRIPSAN